MHWFINPIKNHYADFNGRSTRTPFWFYVLIYIIISSVLSTIEKSGGMNSSLLTSVYGLALLLPSLAITTRRLHDTNRSGWWQLLWFIPVIGWIILVVFLAQDTTPADNNYGTNPKATPATVASVPPEQTNTVAS